MNACTVCKRLTPKERCDVCGNPTSSKWCGLLIITDPEESELAKLKSKSVSSQSDTSEKDL